MNIKGKQVLFTVVWNACTNIDSDNSPLGKTLAFRGHRFNFLRKATNAFPAGFSADAIPTGVSHFPQLFLVS
jgi:hypothetical protein